MAAESRTTRDGKGGDEGGNAGAIYPRGRYPSPSSFPGVLFAGDQSSAAYAPKTTALSPSRLVEISEARHVPATDPDTWATALLRCPVCIGARRRSSRTGSGAGLFGPPRGRVSNVWLVCGAVRWSPRRISFSSAGNVGRDRCCGDGGLLRDRNGGTRAPDRRRTRGIRNSSPSDLPIPPRVRSVSSPFLTDAPCRRAFVSVRHSYTLLSARLDRSEPPPTLSGLFLTFFSRAQNGGVIRGLLLLFFRGRSAAVLVLNQQFADSCRSRTRNRRISSD